MWYNCANGGRKENMLKVVVYDDGYGGELFADQLEAELPVLEVIRVIDWRNSKILQSNPRRARKIAEAALRPYIGKVDLIIFANYLVALTSLKYFVKKYENQTFLGLHLTSPSSISKKEILILGTKTFSRLWSFRNYTFRLQAHITTACLDGWPAAIDDGELSIDDIRERIGHYSKLSSPPEGLIMTCSNFHHIKPELRAIFGRNIKIYDDFKVLIQQVSKTLKIRGYYSKQK